jgi:putative endonuclease
VGERNDAPQDAAWSYRVYVLRCEDGSLYSGITTDVARRMAEHLSRRAPGARYTQRHPAVALVGLWRASDRSSACRLEWRLHHMTRSQKLRLIESPELAGEEWEPVPSRERERLWEEGLRRNGGE